MKNKKMNRGYNKGKDNPMYGKKSPFFGKHHSEETKKKISASRIAMKLSTNIISMKIIFNRYRKSAEKRKLWFDLSYKEFLEMTSSPCYYCGALPISRLINMGNRNYTVKYNGIDRMDNTLGYMPENCVPCCKFCNRMKMQMSTQDFLKKIYEVYHHLIASNLSLLENNDIV